MNYSVETEKNLYRKSGKFIKLFFILVVEVVKANFALLPYIYNKNKKPEPIVAHFKTDRIKTNAGKFLLANCITMTPGTITGSLKGDDYLVHCLDKSMAVGLESSVFVDAIQEWEEK
jgi:multicomponent Na+:H+ antiporter subunit E